MGSGAGRKAFGHFFKWLREAMETILATNTNTNTDTDTDATTDANTNANTTPNTTQTRTFVEPRSDLKPCW